MYPFSSGSSSPRPSSSMNASRGCERFLVAGLPLALPVLGAAAAAAAALYVKTRGLKFLGSWPCGKYHCVLVTRRMVPFHVSCSVVLTGIRWMRNTSRWPIRHRG